MLNNLRRMTSSSSIGNLAVFRHLQRLQCNSNSTSATTTLSASLLSSSSSKAQLSPTSAAFYHFPSPNVSSADRHAAALQNIPTRVRIVEVGPRDGLQNEKQPVPTSAKIHFINLLSQTGLRNIEATSFVSAKAIPQLADANDVLNGISIRPTVVYSVLTPNLKGFQTALSHGVQECAVFAAASESFSRKNINCSIEESIARFEPIFDLRNKEAPHVRIRGYVSCVLGCPYEGPVDPAKVVDVSKRLLNMGCYEVSLGDTIGVGTAGSTGRLLEALLDAGIDLRKVAVHFHNTYGQALSNILCALQYGVSVVDASTAGLGGCPYAKGASGNVATEDVVWMLQGMGIETGIDLDRILEAGAFICGTLGRDPASSVGRALLSHRSNKGDPSKPAA